MRNKKAEVSIIIVNYKAEKELTACISSIFKSGIKTRFEIIIVDNDEKNEIGSLIKEKFPSVKYIKSKENIGYGAGNNLGARFAKGKYLFFLNPDTVIYKNTLDKLVSGLMKDKKIAAVGPQLLGSDGKTVPQGTRTLDILQGIIALSFINKFFPNNIVSRRYFLKDIDKSKPYEADSIAGTALLIKRDIFFRAGIFDEKFFLYFEEFDICRRIKEMGFKIFVIPQAKVRHIWGVSTKQAEFDVKEIFEKSRFYYFKKHFGFLQALLVLGFAGFKKTHLLMVGILAVSFFLNFYKLEKLMIFIGDQGWFYLSARDMVIDGEIPLVGISSSHPWLHQGPLWTYMLAIVLWIFRFNPVSGAYLTAFLGTVTVFLVYFTSSYIFSKRVGIISAVLCATSPLIIMSNRFAYHTSIIPLFTILYILFLYKWIHESKGLYFSLMVLMLAILYNLELFAVYLWSILFFTVLYGLFKKKQWAKVVFEKKVLISSALFFVIPALPFLIYDVNHGFVQTFGFIGWIGYRLFRVFGSVGDYSYFKDSLEYLFSFFYKNVQRLIFLKNGEIAMILFLSSLFYMSSYVFLVRRISQRYFVGFVIILFSIYIGVAAFIVGKTVSDAYLPVFFPLGIIILALFLDKLCNKRFLYVGVLITFFLAISNAYIIVRNDYAYENNLNKITFADRINAARNIVRGADGKEYNIVGKGWLSKFESYIMNYEYLTWWLGHGPSKKNEKLKIHISESENGIKIEN